MRTKAHSTSRSMRVDSTKIFNAKPSHLSRKLGKMNFLLGSVIDPQGAHMLNRNSVASPRWY